MPVAAPIKALIFDCDGVLIESAKIKTSAFSRLFMEICPERVREIVQYHVSNAGISRYVKFKHIYGQILNLPLTFEKEQALGEKFSELVRTELLEAPLVPGAQAFLETASSRRTHLLFVASGTPESELYEVARAKAIFHYCLEWHGSPKSKPEIIRDILLRYGLHPSEVVFIGDAPTDRMAADETGVVFVGRVTEPNGLLADCPYRIPDLTVLSSVLQDLEAGTLPRTLNCGDGCG